MKTNNIEMRVLIKGKPITEYAHNGQTFVEGRHSSNFEIELINHNNFNVEAILSVDGLSVIDGKDAGPESSGYLLKGRETLRIPGWKLNNEAVAAFQFAGKGNSYAALSTGSARNTGVIGVLTYKEKVQTYVPPIFVGYNSPTYGGGALIKGDWVDSGTTGLRGLRGLESMSFGGSCDSTSLCSGNISNGISQTFLNACSFSMSANATSNAIMSSVATSSAAALLQNNLGTAFGQETDFKTTSVSFDRGDMLSMGVVYYDDSRGLKARGIVLQRRPKTALSDRPDAFPGLSNGGCTPPTGWRG